ncbi:BRCA1-A complex subunit BRE [Armadillidium vulgare]|nr:BRCA1-A complex subunit BRE [Armadillidium vulgare]
MSYIPFFHIVLSMVYISDRNCSNTMRNSFLKASLLFDWKNFYFILVIDLPEDFPKTHPIITLRSVYHSSNRSPYKREIAELDVPTQSTPEEIVKAIKISVLHALPDFQSYTINNYK